VKLVQFLTALFPPLPSYLFRPGAKCVPHHPILSHPILCYSLSVKDQVSHPYKSNRKKIIIVSI
jgi:hypothetical protein